MSNLYLGKMPQNISVNVTIMNNHAVVISCTLAYMGTI